MRSFEPCNRPVIACSEVDVTDTGQGQSAALERDVLRIERARGVQAFAAAAREDRVPVHITAFPFEPALPLPLRADFLGLQRQRGGNLLTGVHPAWVGKSEVAELQFRGDP